MTPSAATRAGELPTEPRLQALARLGRGSALLLERDDRAGPRADLEAALALARRHGFDHLATGPGPCGNGGAGPRRIGAQTSSPSVHDGSAIQPSLVAAA